MKKTTWLLALCSCSFSVQAQIKNIKIADAPAGATGLEASIAVSGDKAVSVVVATAPDNIYYSSDESQTWAASKLTSTGGLYGHPVLIADDNGTVYAFHLSDPSGEGLKNEKSLDQILCHISKDGGKTWEEGGGVGLNAPKDQFRPAVTLDAKNNLLMAWTEFDAYKSEEASCQSRILYSTSSNGKKWSKPFELSQTPGDCKDEGSSAEGAMPAITSDGKVFVTWANQNKIFMDRSFSGGSMWLTNDIGVTEQRGGWNLKVPGVASSQSFPILLIDKSKGKLRGSLYLVWTDQRNGADDTDVWFMRSLNYGDNWTSPIRIGEDSKGHQYNPAVAIDPANGNLYILYFDRHAYGDTQTDVYMAYSSNGGTNFQNVKISETPFVPTEAPGLDTRNSISAYKGIITPLWSRTDDGKPSLWTAVIKEADIITPPAPQTAKKKK
ncbi:sialidase family protein [Chryseolinea soli]|uniref:Exo-alpha-sialidase n=1 Tax=Chryseolinea soli TaxID=2321403 RepID=A0A385T1E4_9BACT|nr:sialidase family protein [Chryseolinea soli]AYB34928.1 exo-alpha-sialidase [Chryseolinea soli]